MTISSGAKNTDCVQPAVPHIFIGVTSAQTCMVLPDRLQELRAAGFRVSVLSAPGNIATRAAQIEDVSTYTVPVCRTISPIADMVAFVRILKLLMQLKPDLVEFSTPKVGLLGCVAAWLCRVRVRVYFLRGLRLETTAGLKRWLLLWAERLASVCSHITLCNSGSLRDRAMELRIAPASRLLLLGNGSSNGVDVVRFAPAPSDLRQRLGISDGAPVIGFAGRLTADKGVPELLEAFALILRERPDAHLLLVGWFDAAEDALDQGLRRRVEGHPRILCTGYVADAAPYYRAMDLLVLPSWREGFPNAVLEAAASGVPVIAAACTGSLDAVVPEVTGLLVPPGYPEAICEAVLRLTGDPVLRRQMSESARQWAVDHFDKRRVMGLTTQLYRRLVESSPGFPGANAQKESATGLPVSL
jgi:glycosyltransferase involved in cell wall biosynthesis